MDDRIKYRLFDILSAIDEIESFFDNRPKRYDSFCEDVCLRRAIERDIQIIGEAMAQILKTWPDIPIRSSRKIVSTRNYVVHGYDSLQLDIIWNIVINHLPALREEITEILA